MRSSRVSVSLLGMRLLLLAGVGACSPMAVTPPPRAFALTSPSTPDVRRADAQIGVQRITHSMWGPDLNGRTARVRYTLEPGVTVEADAGMLTVANEGEVEGGDRDAYTGRVGVLLATPDRHFALAAGVGGGVSAAAGSWGGADLLGVVSGQHRHVRPMIGAGLGYSAPFRATPFKVHEPARSGGGERATLLLPRNAFGQVLVGIELGPPKLALVLGASYMRVKLFDESVVGVSGPPDDDAIFLEVGAALRVALY